MKKFTINGNENNPATLKVIVANNFRKDKCEVKIASSNGDNSEFLPHLVVNSSEDYVFMPNAALWILLQPPKELTKKVREFLEIEATVLAPLLATILGTTNKLEASKKHSVLQVLGIINSQLNSSKFLVKDTLTIADIAIFSTLYPVLKVETWTREFLLELTALQTWLSYLELLPEFKDGISKVFCQKISSGQVTEQSNLDLLKTQLSAKGVVSETVVVTPEELNAAKLAWNKLKNQLPKLKVPQSVVLPKPGEKNVFITSSLPYVNNVPHLGNIIGCVLSADVFARYSRLCNNNTLYICGTDEYGTATETKALEEGLSCQTICDKYFEIHRDVYEWFNISFDSFGRTSTPLQTEIAQSLFLRLNNNGFMFTQSVDQLHCEKCNRYLADRFVEGGCPNVGCDYEDARGDQCDKCGKLVNAVELKNPKCKICGNTPKLKSSSQFYIDLPKLEPLLLHWIKKSSPGWSHNADVIAGTWLKEGLKPRCITRDLQWGVPVPLDGYRHKVFYVWFDAPIGYMSISKAYTEKYEEWWRPSQDTDVKLYQFMAKDNVPFHAILFPAILLGANQNYVTVSHIMATEYLNYEDGKFSKSRGIGVFGTDAKNTKIPSDVWRFYLLFIRPETQDSSFSWDDLVTKNNSELLNNLGNFINRALTFVKNNFNKTIPQMDLLPDDYTLLALCTREVKGYINALEKCRLRDGIRHILSISRHGNQYMQQNQPWVKIKEGNTGKIRAGTIVGLCANLAALLSTLLQPYMPETSGKLKNQLTYSDFVLNPNNVEIVNLLPEGHKIGDPQPLFDKIEPELAEEYKKKFAGDQESRKSPKDAGKPTANNNITLNDDLETLQEAVSKQGMVVRKLKESGMSKSVWQPEVAKLLELKQRLAKVSGVDLTLKPSKKK
ncbi:hypothetical protein ABEB36_003254 [Hypothenemus hampei]|uniref:Methionine--tRNA ligase, cytoplasmic n=1 Tax=Hypothenemus hampei TaxID=57062 RepID=A0ABD1F995_HYPHA